MDAYRFAIDMEQDGERYYAEQAELNRCNSLRIVFLKLAEEERAHADLLRRKFENRSYRPEDGAAPSKAENVFKGLDDFKDEIKKLPDQLDLYREAAEKERQSIDLYEGLLAKAESGDERILLEYLIKQERVHLAILEELVVLVGRPDDWVESAEFGKREEY